MEFLEDVDGGELLRSDVIYLRPMNRSCCRAGAIVLCLPLVGCGWFDNSEQSVTARTSQVVQIVQGIEPDPGVQAVNQPRVQADVPVTEIRVGGADNSPSAQFAERITTEHLEAVLNRLQEDIEQ